MPLTKLFTKKDLINYVKAVFESQEYDAAPARKNAKCDLVLFGKSEIIAVNIINDTF